MPDQQAHDPLSCWHLAPGCEDQFRARLLWLGGKRGLHLDGIGAYTWQALIDAGLIHDLLDWLNLTPMQLAKVPNLGQARAAALVQTFADARQRPFIDWLRGMGMPPTADMALPDWATVSARSADDWQTAGAGNAKSEHLVAFFAHSDLRAHAARLHALGVQGF